MPWSIRGIDPEIREQAVEAAQRSGLSVGQWLNQVLSGSLDADEDEAPAYAAPRRARRPARLDDLAERLDRLGKGRPGRSGDNQQMVELLENAVEAMERIERRGLAGVEPPRRAGPERIADILQGLERRLEALNRPEPPAATPRASADNAIFARTLAEIEARRRHLDAEPAPGHPRPESMHETLGALVARIDEMRARPAPDTARLQDRLDEIAARIAEWRGESRGDDLKAIRRDLAGLADSVAQLAPARLVGLVEEAVAGVAGRLGAVQDALPPRLSAAIERMHEDIQAVLREMAGGRGIERLSQEIGNLARRLDGLAAGTASAGRLDEIARETESLRTLVTQALRAQPLEGLARQIDALGRQIEHFRASPDADRAVIDAIRDVRDRLERIDPAAAFRGIEQRLSGIGRIEDKIDALASGMKSLASGVQPLPQLDSIAERLERIDRALDSGRDTPLGGLDQIATRLEAIGATLGQAVQAPAQGEAVLAMLERVAAHLDAARQAPPDAAGLDRLHAEIAHIARRIDENAGEGTRGIERAISDLFAEFDSTRRDLHSAAEKAALRAAQEALRSAPRDEASDALAAEGLLLIKRDLGEFKSAQSEADRRTRQLLEGLQNTLETLVQRMGMLETGGRSHHPAPPERAEAPPAAPAMPAMPTVTPRDPAPPGEPSRTGMKRSAETPEATQTTPQTMEDLPLEPGQRPGEARPADPKASFIAARRAAQAAARSQAETSEAQTCRIAGGQREAAAASAPSASFLVRARKPILLGLAVFVLSVGALKVWTNRNLGPVVEAPPKPAVSAPAEGDEAPRTTQGIGTPSAPAEGQPIPTIGTAKDGKRAQRLQDSNAIAQTDPLAVGSIGGDGTARPIETGRHAVAALIEESGFKGEDALREAALGGNAPALFEIGARFADGRGTARNPQAAARWFEQAAAAGHAPAQYRLASLYREGRGITKDQALAFQWFDRAAAQGHVLAMHNAAVLLAEGVHGAPDYAGAALWFRRAAEHGVKDSQFNIAILFARGLGVNQDLGEAYRWFGIAAAQGDQDAARKRDDIAARLTKDQLAKENERIKAFKPARPNAAANEPGNWARIAARAP
ncbi:SEL1-like repeat protein [Rhabdaerophilum calidifontis]|uniref:SEL1-like repeat protein n=1 Tax=Rhabdaerophilum calidifontis TaxID=2604328 RepID=UPI001409EAF1|nr:SEL1-like repeat protein [Rhabdaerophilum calidifontis]